MKTIILCGGEGTRLKEETEFKPKPMVYIGDKPLIWHIMKIYSYYGFNEFILALGYKGDYIKNYFLNQKALTTDFTLNTRNFKTKFYFEDRTQIDNFNITFVDTGLKTLPGERIMRCQKYIPKKDKYFMVTYGDGVSDIDIRELVRFHKRQKTIGTITGIHPRFKFGTLSVDTKSRVTFFSEKPVLHDFVNGGYMVFDKRYFKYQKDNELEHEALKRLSKENQLSLYKHSGFWFAVDTHKEYEMLNKLWNSGRAQWKVWP